jgi:hypothetical protein
VQDYFESDIFKKGPSPHINYPLPKYTEPVSLSRWILPFFDITGMDIGEQPEYPDEKRIVA